MKVLDVLNRIPVPMIAALLVLLYIYIRMGVWFFLIGVVFFFAFRRFLKYRDGKKGVLSNVKLPRYDRLSHTQFLEELDETNKLRRPQK